MTLVFVGPKCDDFEIVPYSDEILVYGWEGSDFVALQENRLMEPRPTVDDIIRQELEIAKNQVTRTGVDFPIEQIAWTQQTLDLETTLSDKSQDLASEVAAVLAIELALSFQHSSAATNMLWEVVSRCLRMQGLFLSAPKPEAREAVWDEHPGLLDRRYSRPANIRVTN